MALNSSVLTCVMPEVLLPSDFQVNDTESVRAGGGVASLSGGPYDRDQADIYVGLVFDGFRHYDNLTTATPNITFQFYQPPMIDNSTDVIIYRPHHYADIYITVRQSFQCLFIKVYYIDLL